MNSVSESSLCLMGQKHGPAVDGADNVLCKEKEPFEKQLYKFMREQKTPIKRLPSLGFKEGPFTVPPPSLSL